MPVDQGPVGWLHGGIAWLTVLAAAGLVAIVLVLIFRERHHKRRRHDLQRRLADLESILIGVAFAPQTATLDAAVSSTGSGPVTTSASELPRGPLSTAISMLRSDLGAGLPGPDRVDLRSMLFVYEQMDQPLTPSDLADGLNLSLRSLQRGLAGSLSCTPRELILAVKMREAKRRLVDEDLRVQEAARAVGFDDPFHFSRRFKAYYGVAPSELHSLRDRSVA